VLFYELRLTIAIIIIIVLEDCKKIRKNLNMAWIDYQKAFYSVPHRWIEKSIELIGVNYKIVKFCKLSMEKWSTKL
jgi:hypothetical protein